MKKLTMLLAVAGLAALGAPAAASETFAVDPVHSEVSFEIRHLITKVRGGFNTFEGEVFLDRENPANSTVSFTIDAASIDTQNERRDNHLRTEDFFHVEEHPAITFESSAVKEVGSGKYLVTGDFTMRGVTKTITLPVELTGTAVDPWGNTRVGFSAETTVDRTEFDVAYNRELEQGGTLLGNEVTIDLEIQAVQKKDEEPAG